MKFAPRKYFGNKNKKTNDSNNDIKKEKKNQNNKKKIYNHTSSYTYIPNKQNTKGNNFGKISDEKNTRDNSNHSNSSEQTIPNPTPINTAAINSKQVFQKKKFEVQRKTIQCMKCKINIDDISTAFEMENDAENENKYYICFDCASKEIREKYNVPPKSKIIYLGAGTFGEVKDLRIEKNFIILRRFKYCKPKFEKFAMSYLPDCIE